MKSILIEQNLADEALVGSVVIAEVEMGNVTGAGVASGEVVLELFGEDGSENLSYTLSVQLLFLLS